MPGWSEQKLRASCAMLQAAVLGGRQGNVLLIKHAVLPWPNALCVARDQQSFGQAFQISMGAGKERYSGLSCRSKELPFTDASFRQVVLWHVIAAGQEPELQEACRVLSPGGDLLIVGLNHLAVGARFDRKSKQLPRLHFQMLGQRLQDLEMEVTGAMGTGLAGIGNAIIRQGSWSGLLLPFADQILLKVQHVSPSGLSPLLLDRFQAGAVPSA